VSTVAYVPISYHTRAQSPSPRVSPPAIPNPKGGKATLPTACPNAAVAEFGYTSLGSQIVDGVLVCVYQARRAELGVAISDKKATAHTCADAEPIDIPGAEAAWIDNGSCGTPAVIVVVSDGTLKVTGGDRGRNEIIAVAKRILG
jgi:hypothetical protein